MNPSPDSAAPVQQVIVVERPPAPLQLYARAAASISKKFGRRTAANGSVPTVKLVRPSVMLDAGRVERYARVCGFIPEQGVPATFAHLLGFDLQMMLMTDPRFPWPALGIVHLSNAIRQHRALEIGQSLRVEVSAGPMLCHDKGQAFLFMTRLFEDDACVWEGDSVYLKRGIAAPRGAPMQPLLGLPATPSREDATTATLSVQPTPGAIPLVQLERWQLDAGLGRRYADVSGDRNPIHMGKLAARLFGFPAPLAHGMWTIARAVAALTPTAPSAPATRAARVTILGEFKTPLLLPAEPTLWGALPHGGERRFEVRDGAGEKPHLRGSIDWPDWLAQPAAPSMPRPAEQPA